MLVRLEGAVEGGGFFYINPERVAGLHRERDVNWLVFREWLALKIALVTLRIASLYKHVPWLPPVRAAHLSTLRQARAMGVWSDALRRRRWAARNKVHP